LGTVKIVVADPLPPSALDVLRQERWTVDELVGAPRPRLAAALGDADALVVRSATRVDGDLLAAAPALRAIARAGTGVDNVDLDAASARGIVVLNAPGANSVSVAEHTLALMLALARNVTRADRSLKAGRWEKARLTGIELRGKTLGIVGLGRVGQEVALRARAFGMHLLAHDPYIASQVAEELGVDLVALDELCARADFISLHVPSTPATRHLFDAARLGQIKPGARLINTARGDLVDEDALADAIEAGRLAGAALDVFQEEPPRHHRLLSLPQVIVTPHIAASTAEAQELVGLETARCLRDFLRDGLVRNAVNFPSIPAEEFRRLRPYVRLAERMGTFLAQLADGRMHALGIRYYGDLTQGSTELLASAALVGLFRPMLASSVTPVNARAVAAERGLELIESRSSRPRNFTSLISLKLHTSAGERWIEGAVFEPASPRLVLIDGVEIEAPLEGTLLVLRNNDQPGVIGEVGTILGRHGVNIATFALGRREGAAVGIVTLDEPPEKLDPRLEAALLGAIRAVAAVRDARLVRL
jgi:D-3-phosphoglycerate dehydrogenase